jgi:hypothetical protein
VADKNRDIRIEAPQLNHCQIEIKKIASDASSTAALDVSIGFSVRLLGQRRSPPSYPHPFGCLLIQSNSAIWSFQCGQITFIVKVIRLRCGQITFIVKVIRLSKENDIGICSAIFEFKSFYSFPK